VKINQVQLKETKEENQKTHEKVLANREYETQAAIIRVMKGEKSISHAQLIAKVVELTIKRGVLPPAEIKKQIERYVTCVFLCLRLLM
jgi:Cullin protein neddylation domain